MSEYLVTGGCGFIGSHLVDALLDDGNSVRVLDNLSTGKRSNLSSRAELIVGDIADCEAVRKAIKGTQGCFHLAAIASVEQCNFDWTNSHVTNLTGTINVFDAARSGPDRAPIPVVYASSAAIYGDNASMPLVESATARPLTAYGADKLGCEQHARVAGLIHQIPTMGFRFFNIYGPRQDPKSPYSGVISIFAAQILAGDPVTVFGDGLQVRDFVYVSDVVAFLVRGMEKAATVAPVFNVCTGKGTNIIQLARCLASANGSYLDMQFHAGRPGDICISLGDPALSANVLQKSAKIPLGVGLRKTLEFMRPPIIETA